MDEWVNGWWISALINSKINVYTRMDEWVVERNDATSGQWTNKWLNLLCIHSYAWEGMLYIWRKICPKHFSIISLSMYNVNTLIHKTFFCTTPSSCYPPLTFKVYSCSQNQHIKNGRGMDENSCTIAYMSTRSRQMSPMI